MGKKLSDTEIDRRLVRLRNLERLYAKSRVVNGELRIRIKELETRDRQRTARERELEAKLQEQAIVIAELQKAVFGKKRRGGGQPAAAAFKPRDKASYRRALPAPDEVTAERCLPLEETCACSGTLRRTESAVRFEEDIPLSGLSPGYKGKLVTKLLIARGVCLACGRSQTAADYDLSGQTVRLGKNVRLLICHLISSGLSYAQTVRLLQSLYGLEISSGEIAGILKEKHRAWQPACQSLLAGIRASPYLHIDETAWPRRDLQGAGHAWVVSAGDKTCFALTDGRGGAHARELLKGFTGVRITDNYAAYSNPALAGKHQLCWAHLYRNIRDLRSNANLPPDQADYVTRWYESFAGLYKELRERLAEPAAGARSKRTDELRSRLKRLLNDCPPPTGEPLKLTKLKAQLRRADAAGKLFVCLEESTPCDNNQAERDLRPLVIKRKISFGSVSEAGAAALATVISLCANTWRTDKDNYFQALANLG